jgi:hypothetical protein
MFTPSVFSELFLGLFYNHLFRTIYFRLQCILLLSLFLLTTRFGRTRTSSVSLIRQHVCAVWYIKLLISQVNAKSINLNV